MPLKIEVDKEHQLVRTTVEGEVHLADVLGHLTKENEDGALGYRELVDGTAAAVQLSPNDIRQIVYVLRKLSLQQRLGATAVVVPSDFAYGMMRMLGILVEDVCHIEVFRSEAEARSSLGLQ